MFWVTFVGVIVVGLTGLATFWQAKVANDTLRVTLLQQRAWLKVEASPMGPLFIDDRSASFSADVKVTNVGSIPALNTSYTSRIISGPGDGKGNSARAPRGYFDNCKTGALDREGYTVFPGQTLTLPYSVVNITTSEMFRFSNPGQGAGLLLLICASYLSGGSKTVHQTGATFLLGRKEQPRYEFTKPVGGGTKAEVCCLAPMGMMEKAD